MPGFFDDIHAIADNCARIGDARTLRKLAEYFDHRKEAVIARHDGRADEAARHDGEAEAIFPRNPPLDRY